MNNKSRRVRVLYSFPHKLGADRICYTAWQQVNGLAAAGADILVMPGALHRAVPAGVRVQSTLARGRVRIPYSAIGSRRAFALHDYIVARRLKRLAGHVDIVHGWSQGSRRTFAVAAEMGIPTVLERPNAHTRFAYEVVQRECERLGVSLPPGHEHQHNEDILRIEEHEFDQAYRLLCPSDFVVQTYLARGFSPERLARHIYGFDEKMYVPGTQHPEAGRGLNMLFVGVCAVRKGVHFALEAWLKSSAHRTGTFRIAGEFLPSYAEKLGAMLSHPSVQVLGHRTDVPQLMRESDILVLPSIEEGFGLVCTEAMGSGCVPLVSDACTDLCRHMENAVVHHVGDVDALTSQISMVNDDRVLLSRLRSTGLKELHNLTWTSAGRQLLNVYCQTISAYESEKAGHSPAVGV
jgi:glycosyltransferase involved in cell wall biosynthesis